MISTLLDRLPSAKQTGPHKWKAQCPAHDDRSPSLYFRVADDGKILIHCFGGCSAGDVLAALGLSLSDLFPAPTEHAQKGKSQAWPAVHVLKSMAAEAAIVALAVADLRDGLALNDDDLARIELAAERLQAAANLAGGGP